MSETAWVTEHGYSGLDEQLAPGVVGYTWDCPEGLYVPLIAATRPGSGDVGRYLDSLPRDRRVVFPTVLSRVLEGMLERRGFTRGREWAEEVDCYADIWERLP